MITKNITWNVTRIKGATHKVATDFDVVAPNLEYAACDALLSLGWDMTPSRNLKMESEPEPDLQPDSSDETLVTDSFISSEILDLAKDKHLRLLLLLDGGFFTNRSLSREFDGSYLHQGGNGDATQLSAEDFLRIYPDTLGKVWSVVDASNKPKLPGVQFNPLSRIKAFFASSFCLLAFSRMILG